MKPGRISRLLSLVWLACFSVAGVRAVAEERLIGVAKDDPEMNQAMAEAKNSEEDFSIKLRITDGKEVEYFWCSDLKIEKGVVTAEIGDEPELVKTVQEGLRITVKEADIVDWLYMKHDKMIGNYTARPLMKSMRKEEAEYLKQTLGPLPE